MKHFIKISFILSFAFIIFSCSNRNQTSMMKNVTGKAGELVVVISPNAWDAEPGTSIRDILAQPQLFLPQDEPIFNLINIPHEGYGDIFRTSRNLVITKIGASVKGNSISFKRNVNAYTQAIIYVNATSNDEFVELFNENADKIAGFFLKAERDRLIMNYSKYNEKAVSNKTKEHFGLSINVPPGFKVVEQKDNFMWIRFETVDQSQGILIYSYPYESDKAFTSDYMLIKRNIVLKNNVPGPTNGSYMTTEKEFPVMYNVMKHNGNYASEMRGLWKVENDFMGGPFVSLSMLDLLDNRIVTVEAYVYAPHKDKRNYIRQVEAMIYSSEFTNQEDIDKINTQFELE